MKSVTTATVRPDLSAMVRFDRKDIFQCGFQLFSVYLEVSLVVFELVVFEMVI